MIRIPFDNRFARLGEPFFARAQPTPVTRPALIRFNLELARELGIAVDGVGEAELAGLFSGNAMPPGAELLALQGDRSAAEMELSAAEGAFQAAGAAGYLAQCRAGRARLAHRD